MNQKQDIFILYKTKKAFTLLEIIFVIVIIGILSSVLLPRFTRPTLQEAANQVVSHIQYTQHLAMVDNKFDPKDRYWYKLRWQIKFEKSKKRVKNSDDEWSYTIYSDTKGKRTGKPDPGEIAVNPLKKGQLLCGGSSGTLDWEDERATREMNLGKKYNIQDIKTSGCLRSKRMAFDYMGRPIGGNTAEWKSPYPLKKVLKNQCKILLCTVLDCKNANSTEIIIIAIEPETGYTHILK